MFAPSSPWGVLDLEFMCEIICSCFFYDDLLTLQVFILYII